MTERLLLSAVEAANIIGVSERKYHALRKNPDFPKPTVLGPRCLRWHVEDIQNWVRNLAAGEGEAGTGIRGVSRRVA